jgi:hypothetical protein
MNDFDLTDLLERILQDYWDARILLDGRSAWADVPMEQKNLLKEQVLPWIYRAEPFITAKAKADVNRFIRDAREVGLTDTEIVAQLDLESQGA